MRQAGGEIAKPEHVASAESSSNRGLRVLMEDDVDELAISAPRAFKIFAQLQRRAADLAKESVGQLPPKKPFLEVPATPRSPAIGRARRAI